MNPSLLIWDFNGTILNDGHLLVAVNNEMNRKRGLPEITYDYYREHFSHPPKPFYEKQGYNFDNEDYGEISRIFLERYEELQQEAELMPHVIEILTWAKEQGIPQIILSAHKQDMLERHLQRLGIMDFFSHVSGESSHIIGGKVERAKALAESGAFDFSHAVLIGDTDHDFHAAQAMDAACILCSAGHQTVERLKATGAVVISDLSQIPHIIPTVIRKDVSTWKQKNYSI